MIKFYHNKIMKDIANALRTRLGTTKKYKASEIPAAITGIPKGYEWANCVAIKNFMGSGSTTTSSSVISQIIPSPSQSLWNRVLIFPNNMSIVSKYGQHNALYVMVLDKYCFAVASGYQNSVFNSYTKYVSDRAIIDEDSISLKGDRAYVFPAIQYTAVFLK